MKHQHTGFTLIELMIVVAIIAILAAIAIPQYQTYVIRSQVTRAVSEASTQIVPVEDCLTHGGTVMGMDNCTPTATSSDILDGGTPVIDMSDISAITIKAKFGQRVNPLLAGKEVTYLRNASGAWHCTFSGDARYAPVNCPHG